jgi:eukaryotic-like serine/threonine-protein kinase
LIGLRDDSPEAKAKLAPLIEAELRRLLSERLQEGNPTGEVQAATLITDAYVALFPGQKIEHSARLRFASLAAPSLRRLSLEYARQVQSDGSSYRYGSESCLFFNLSADQFITLDEQINRLAKLDDKHWRVVELKVFAGLREEDIGDLLVCSAQSVRSVWHLARAWLFEQLADFDAITAAVGVGMENSHSSPNLSGTADAAAHHDGKVIEWTPERWQWVSKLFVDAVNEDYDQRSVWLRSHCRGDVQLEIQLGLLLAADQRAGNFLEAADLLTVDYSPPDRLTHSLECGQIISGRFKILRFVDSGGMGEVYEAWDLELKERVALKTIRPEVASDPAVIERFKREVRQARGISHPNVCRVYDLFSHGETSLHRIWFLTMELLEGETLLEALRRRSRMPVDDVSLLVEQLVAGLAEAHRLGIVHRDFKSGNVMLVIDGNAGRTRAVITEFGLALNLSTLPLGTAGPGGEGTPDYMAPEQRQEGPVGFAADQYALGVVMCEMLTGHRPRRCSSATAGGEAALLPPDHQLPPRWERVIRRCLQMRPEDRYLHVSDVILALHPRRQRKRIAWVTATVAITMGLAVAQFWPRAPTIEALAQLTPDTDFSGEASLSHDGRTVAYSSDRAETGNLDIWVQGLPSSSPVRITADPADDRTPSISPDGRSVVWRSSKNGGGILVSEVTGHGQRLLVPAGRNPVFSPDGHKVVYWVGDEDATIASGQLFLLSLDGGGPVRLAAGFKDARLPTWSSDGRYVLFTGCLEGKEAMPACAEWWVTSTVGGKLQNTGALALLRKRGIVVLGPVAGWQGDHVLFGGRGGTGNTLGDGRNLWDLRLSPEDFRATGELRQLTESGDVVDATSVAENGTVVFSRLAGALHVWRISHAADPAMAVTTKVTQDAAFDQSPYISRNARWLVFARGFGNHHDLWIKDQESGSESLLLASRDDVTSPIIDETGKIVVFESRKHDATSLLVAHQGEPPTVFFTGCSKPTGWFEGGRTVFCREGEPSKIKMVNLETGEARTVLESQHESLSEASWSPESEHLLFKATSEGGAKRIYAVSLPKATAAATGEWIPITSDSERGDRPRWSGDGRAIFYLSARDGYWCLWGQHFDPSSGKVKGLPFAVMHYHNVRFTPEAVIDDTFQMSVAGESVYLNIGEIRDTIWTGVLKRRRLLSLPHSTR